MSNWKKVPLEELLVLVIDHRGKTPKKMGFLDFDALGYPVLSAKHVKTDGLVNQDSLRFANEEMYKKWMKDEVQEGDIVLTSEAPLGEVFYIDGKTKYVLGQRVFGLRPLREKLEPFYLFAWLASGRGQAELTARSSGSTVTGIRQSELLKICVDLPPIEVQEMIAKNRKDLDDKIENNRQINKSLEKIAQALFKSWFVNFDPVHAKAEAINNGGNEEDARIAAMSAISGKTKEELATMQTISPEDYAELESTANAFPSSFVESELGLIPEEWEVTKIQDVAKTIKGQSYRSSELAESNTALVTLKSFNRGGGYRLDGLKAYTGTYKEEQVVFAGDLIIAYTDVTQAADVIGKPAMVISDSRYDRLVVSLDVAVVRPENPALKYFLYGLAKTEIFQQHTNAHSTGTTVLHLSKNAVPDYLFSLPQGALIEAYEKIATPLFSLINESISENKTLLKVRDVLLPRLLSGEIEISNCQLMETRF